MSPPEPGTPLAAFLRLRTAIGQPTADSVFSLPRLLDIPGVIAKNPIAASDGTMDADSLSFQPTLLALWKKIAASNWYTDYQIRLVTQIIQAGFPIYPASALSITNTDPLNQLPRKPPLARDADWQAVVDGFKASMGEYYKRNLAAAKSAGLALEANTALWNGIYKVVETVADAPKAIAGAALSWAFDWRLIGLIAVVGIGYVLFTQRGKLADAAGSKLAAKIG